LRFIPKDLIPSQVQLACPLDTETLHSWGNGEVKRMHSLGSYPIGNTNREKGEKSKEKHFGDVYHKHYGKIYRICQRYSSKRDEAEDLTHDVFLLYYVNFNKFRNESCPSTWMYRVAINLGIHRWRKTKTQYVDDKVWESIPAYTHDTESALLDKITLDKILAQCPELTRKILSLFHYERMTQVEIGTLLGISRSTVTRHLIYIQGLHSETT
jgi:RNA polymerase sigma factor (sigma-70 family)